MIHSRELAEISSLKTKPDRVPSGQFLLLVRGYFTVKVTVIAECGTGKTLISLGAVHPHSERKPFTALAMVPPQLVEKWAREAFLTLPRVRVFFIDGLRTRTSSAGHAVTRRDLCGRCSHDMFRLVSQIPFGLGF